VAADAHVPDTLPGEDRAETVLPGPFLKVAGIHALPESLRRK
jgi:hypothetical protein